METTQMGTRPDARQTGGASAGTDSLIDRASRMLRPAETEESSNAEPSPEVAEAYAVYCFDGYRRVTPVQRYRTPEGYQKRRLIKWLVTIGFFLLIGAALIALIRSNLFGRFV